MEVSHVATTDRPEIICFGDRRDGSLHWMSCEADRLDRVEAQFVDISSSAKESRPGRVGSIQGAALVGLV